MEKRALVVKRVTSDSLAQKDHQDPKERQELWDSQDLKETREMLGW